MWLEAVQESEGHAQRCPCCGGPVQRRLYGEMYAGSFIHDGQRVEIRRVPSEGFIDCVVLDPLTQYFDGSLYRHWPSEMYYSCGGKKLHRDVWTSAFGPIPKGCHIHHKDSNPANNALSNLECVDASEHLSSTWHRSRAAGLLSPFGELAREKAADWHRSEAGRLWHSRHAKRTKSWTKWKREERECPNCRKPFNALVRAGNSQKYCSEKCKMADYRKRNAAK